MKVIENKTLPAGTIINHNGALYEIGAYLKHNGQYEVYDVEDNKEYALTKNDIKGDYIEEEVKNRIDVKMYPTNCSVFIELWNSRDLRFRKVINTDGVEIEDKWDAASYADWDVEYILSDLLEKPYTGFELTDEEIEYLKSELEFYYNVYRCK